MDRSSDSSPGTRKRQEQSLGSKARPTKRRRRTEGRNDKELSISQRQSPVMNQQRCMKRKATTRIEDSDSDLPDLATALTQKSTTKIIKTPHRTPKAAPRSNKKQKGNSGKRSRNTVKLGTFEISDDDEPTAGPSCNVPGKSAPKTAVVTQFAEIIDLCSDPEPLTTGPARTLIRTRTEGSTILILTSDDEAPSPPKPQPFRPRKQTALPSVSQIFTPTPEPELMPEYVDGVQPDVESTMIHNQDFIIEPSRHSSPSHSDPGLDVGNTESIQQRDSITGPRHHPSRTDPGLGNLQPLYDQALAEVERDPNTPPVPRITYCKNPESIPLLSDIFFSRSIPNGAERFALLISKGKVGPSSLSQNAVCGFESLPGGHRMVHGMAHVEATIDAPSSHAPLSSDDATTAAERQKPTNTVEGSSKHSPNPIDSSLETPQAPARPRETPCQSSSPGSETASDDDRVHSPSFHPRHISLSPQRNGKKVAKASSLLKPLVTGSNLSPTRENHATSISLGLDVIEAVTVTTTSTAALVDDTTMQHQSTSLSSATTLAPDSVDQAEQLERDASASQILAVADKHYCTQLIIPEPKSATVGSIDGGIPPSSPMSEYQVIPSDDDMQVESLLLSCESVSPSPKAGPVTKSPYSSKSSDDSPGPATPTSSSQPLFDFKTCFGISSSPLPTKSGTDDVFDITCLELAYPV
ncbi:hypothetical protein FA15DRAFT_151186 [Coprinopsis marcescibilis]|uniref:Uncharacterized protein n=1 Tax=Coprinopsis marcescibilis TaxID=230819 RepID=A0A5C3KIN6_COPMA|nr:hypothetical protein FA15DRAFT_151186 [Coprinopsis marcescibilis]